METRQLYTGPERRLLDPTRQRLTNRDHAVRAISVPDAEGKTRFGANGREDISAVDAAQLKGGEQFRGEVLAVLGRLRTEFTPEELDMLPALHTSYDEMVKGLEDKEIPLAGMPTWEAIQAKLTPDDLRKALLMKERGMEPRLVLTPPQTRQQLVTAIDQHKVQGQTHNTALYDFTNDDLFNGGMPEPSPSDMKWEVDIMETVTDVADDKAITGLNENRANAWIVKIEKLGLELVNDARLYESAVIQALSAGRRLDPNTYTVLNAKTRKTGALLGDGSWGDARLGLNYAGSGYSNVYLRARAKVRVEME